MVIYIIKGTENRKILKSFHMNESSFKVDNERSTW